MLLNKPIVLVVLLLAAAPASAAALAEQCGQVSCDCDALVDQKWRSECVAQERRVKAECGSAGALQSYCGLHGPSAFPVATSIQSGQLALQPADGSKALLKQVGTQDWSLGETYTAFQGAIKRRQYGQAIQLASLLDKDSQKYFELQKQAVAALLLEGKAREGQTLAAEYAAANIENAEALAELSGQLWQKIADTNVAKEQRAYKILSFKAARTAAAVYEFGADLYGDAKAPEQAAHFWQQSASMAQKLIGWESITENNPKHLSYYQAQASARWHRATFYWLRANKLEQVARSSDYARSYREQDSSGKGIVSTRGEDDLHTLDRDDTRAIKRGN